ncbi:MAG: PQQ-dependent sugar dehydrogenase [Isosphaeraceae bacterium]
MIIEWASNGHDGGDLDFGNDGYLYVSSGDGSSGSDAHLTGQSLDDLLAAAADRRVDHPDAGRNYSVPKDNPFVNRPGARPEIWAYGLRNPWRMSFDHPSGQLWVGQNGQDLWEQVYLIKKGAKLRLEPDRRKAIPQADRKAGPDPIQPPTAEHSHKRGPLAHRRPGLSRQTLPDPRRRVPLRRLVDRPGLGHQARRRKGHSTASWSTRRSPSRASNRPFGRAVCHRPADRPLPARADHRADRPKQAFPTKLSETGLFTSVKDLTPVAAAIPFDVAGPQGRRARRWNGSPS